MKQVSFLYFVLMIGIIIIGCKTSNNPIGDNSDILGCMEVSACNYDSKANIPNDSCVFTKDCNGECGGIAELDVCGVCEGSETDSANCVEEGFSLDFGKIITTGEGGVAVTNNQILAKKMELEFPILDQKN